MQLKPLFLAAATVAAIIAAPALLSSGVAADLNKQIPAPVSDPANKAATETAVLAGGCFWGQQGLFEHVKGVTRVVAGYSGGTKETANYDAVGNQQTDHAEAVEITFDPKQVTFGQLLQIYFSVAHDPTQLNRQGPDRGASYRTEIFAASPVQEATAEAYIAQLEAARIFPAAIVTKLGPLKAFYWAEASHQDYLVKNPNSSYIRANDLPKIEALKRVWPQFWRETPALLARS
jgi:peptide-methionine (S)-S-oxide reductase